MTTKNTQNSKSRTNLGFTATRAEFCCGIIEIGDFQLEVKNRWDRSAPEPKAYSPTEGLELFQERLRESVMDRFCDGAYEYRSEGYAQDRVALVQASVVPNEFIKDGYSQNIAKEYLEADGFTQVAKFANVNSQNTVLVYHKICPVGQWLYDEYNGVDTDED